MKIGIMTFWWSNDNYGQLLQVYALQKFLNNRGHNAYLIRYRVQKKFIVYYILKALNLPLFFRWLKNHQEVYVEQKNHDRKFNDFRNKYINQSELLYSSIDELKANPPEADIYIVGSDQVWNNFHNPLKTIKKRVHAYFLDFGNSKTKRLSYAASWGVDSISEDYCREIEPLLAKFEYVSVREKSGIEICKKCSCLNAELVCDPTLLLSANVYRTLYRQENVAEQNKKYLFLYLLKNPCDINIQSVYNFANQKGLSVVYVTGNGRIDEFEKEFATIPEWLSLVDNAEYVVTNSFHCAVFSTIFHKAFGVIPITGKNIEMNNRFDSLFELRGTGSRYIKNEDYSILDKTYEVKEVHVSDRFLAQLDNYCL